MTVAVIGANGRSGRAFVDAALVHGFEVRAGVHRGSMPPRDNLTVVRCDATNQTDVESLLTGSDAIVSLIGHVRGSPAQVQTEAIRAVLAAAQSRGIKRVISLTGTGVRFPGDKLTLIDRILNLGIKFIDIARVTDGIEHAKLLQASSADWTLLRVLKLSNGKVGKFILSAHGPAKLFSSRAEVAEAIIELLDERSFVRQAPVMQKP